LADILACCLEILADLPDIFADYYFGQLDYRNFYSGNWSTVNYYYIDSFGN